MIADWSPWQAFPRPLAFSQEALDETIDGGQSFRWRRGADAHWFGVCGRHVVSVRLSHGLL